MKRFWSKYFGRGQISFEWLIASVVIATAVIWFLYFLSLAFDLPVGHWWQKAALPGEWRLFLRQPWSLLTYAWVHTGLIGFLVNLLLLYYIGNLFLIFESERNLLRLFWAGILAGGTAFLLTYAALPFLYRDEPQAYLTGISAGYMIWLAYLAAKYGNYDVPVRLVGRVKIKYIFYFFLVLDLLLLFTANSGGHVAHLAAALTGWLSATTVRRPVIQKKARTVDFPNIYDNYKTSREKEIDRILEKINRSGYESLSEREKEILYRESQRK